MENYFVELQLDEKWFKAVMDLIDVDIYDGEVCRVNRIEVIQWLKQMRQCTRRLLQALRTLV